MVDYINELKTKYRNVIRELSTRMNGGDSGVIIKKASEIAISMGIKSNNAEIRDALITFATSGELKIEKYVPRRLEIKFKKEGIKKSWKTDALTK